MQAITLDRSMTVDLYHGDLLNYHSDQLRSWHPMSRAPLRLSGKSQSS